jgi:4-phosphopantoate--beta-alanine ligase
MGKKVIAIDLNPLSRTARKATVSIVDNIMRAVPNLTEQVKRLRAASLQDLEEIVQGYDNIRILRQAVEEMRDHLDQQFQNSFD